MVSMLCGQFLTQGIVSGTLGRSLFENCSHLLTETKKEEAQSDVAGSQSDGRVKTRYEEEKKSIESQLEDKLEEKTFQM